MLKLWITTRVQLSGGGGVPTCTQIRMCVQVDAASIGFSVTAKPVLNDHSKIDKKILMTNGSLMKVESKGSILQHF